VETEVRRQCAAEVGDGTGWHWDPCRNPGKVKDGGKWWCGVHDPIKKREREEARSAAFNTRIERMGERGRRAEAYPELLEALKEAHRQAPWMHFARLAIEKAELQP
jgi:hypothetical protein